MFIDIRNLQERRQARDSQFEDTRDIRNGYLFEVNGSVEGDRDGLVWFKALDGNSAPFQVFYDGIIGDLRANMYVKIERKPKDPARWQIKEFYTNIYFDDQSAYEQLPSTSMIPKKEDYEWPPGFPGAKALNIFPRAITDFAVRPTRPASMKARVYSGIYPGATNYARFQGPVNTKDFTADVPGAGLARLAAISIDNSGTLNYTNGATFVDGLPMPDASLPAVPASEMLISAIRLVNGMTAIEESNFDLEMRPLMANSTVNVKVSEVWRSTFGSVAIDTDANGNVGIGISPPDSDARLHVLKDGFVPLRVERETTNTNSISATLDLFLSGPSIDMADGFGPSFNFSIDDISGVKNAIARISGVRSGGDTSGSIKIDTKNAGSLTTKVTILNTGELGVGTETPGAVAELVGTGTDILKLHRLSEIAAGTTRLEFAVDTTYFKSMIYHERDSGVTNGIGSLRFAVDGNDDASDVSQADVKMVILNDGNVGIGTTSPGSLMEWNMATEDLEFVDAGSAGATEQDWIEVQVGGATGYIRVFPTK